MSIGWEEGSGFLQSGMEPRGGTMGPGTAPHHPPPRLPTKAPAPEDPGFWSSPPDPSALSSGRTARPAGSQRHLPS